MALLEFIELLGFIELLELLGFIEFVESIGFIEFFEFRNLLISASPCLLISSSPYPLIPSSPRHPFTLSPFPPQLPNGGAGTTNFFISSAVSVPFVGKETW
jgi:hypothetical protein